MRHIYLCFILMVLFVTGSSAREMPGLKIGELAPDFETLNYQAEKIRLSNIYRDGPTVLVFYRGGWCPYCNIHLQQLQSRLSDFQDYNASIVAVSVDKVVNAAATVKDKELGFEVISNPDANILESYGLVYKVSDDLNKKYKEQYQIDLEAASGRTDHVIAIPATYIIDADGIIVFAYANEDYKVRTSPEEILEALEDLVNQGDDTLKIN